MSLLFPISDEPTALEKIIQLERILEGETFRKKGQPGMLLRRLVEDAMRNVIPDERTIGIELFGRAEDWEMDLDNIVRQNKSRVMGFLEKYYDNEGAQDRIFLELRGYKAIFTYNPRNPVEWGFRNALRHLVSDPKLAYSHLNEVLSIDPSHAESLAALAELQLWQSVMGLDVDIAGRLETAEAFLEQAFRLDRECWRAHVVRGAICACRMDWKAAGKFFTAAAACRSSRAQNHPWYGAFLMATGRAEEALELAAAVASSPSDSAWPMLIYAAFLYAARRFDSAGRVILESRGIVSETWVSHVLFSLLTLRPERGGIPPPFLGMSIGQNLPDGTAIYTALSLAENLKRLPEDSPEYAALRSLLRAWIEEKERAYIEPFDDEEPPQFRIQRVSPFNLAIGYMTLGEHARAIELLGVDLERGHPLMAWLHLWPIFDPLRQLPEFKRLILKMKLPKTAARLSQKFHSHR